MQRITTVLDKLSDRYLISFVKERQYLDKLYSSNTQVPQVYFKRHLPRDACLELIWRDIIEQGYHQLVENLTAKDLKDWTARMALDQNVSSLGMKKRLQDDLILLGLQEFAPQNHLSRKLLRSALSSLEIESESNDADELVGLLYQELIQLGLEYILTQLSMKLLNDMVKDAELNIKSTSKKLVVRHLMAMQDYNPPRKSSTSSPTQKNTSPTKESTKKRKIRPEDLSLIFESDDSVDWDPKGIIEDDISIADEDDGDKDPNSDSEMEEEGSDVDYVDERKKKKSHKPKRRRYSQKSTYPSGSESN